MGGRTKVGNREFPWGKLIFFVTGNIHKFNEAGKTLAKYNIATAMLKIKQIETQDDDIENIAKNSALVVANKSRLPIIVEDAGLFIEALKGFPGPFSSYVFETLGNEGILKLMEDVEDRKAQFRSVVVFGYSNQVLECFTGVTEGKIAEGIRGNSGFGFDPIFEPVQLPGKTFGEVSTEEKNKISHRAKALAKFADWYVSK